MIKYLSILTAAIIPMICLSCGGKNASDTKPDPAAADAAAESRIAEPAHQADQLAVIDLTADDVVRPDMEVSRLTILDFNATWCGPCREFAPVFDNAAKTYGNSVDFISIDVDKCPETADAFGIRAIPTVIFLYPNGTTATFVGTDELIPEPKFSNMIEAGLKIKSNDKPQIIKE